MALLTLIAHSCVDRWVLVKDVSRDTSLTDKLNAHVNEGGVEGTQESGRVECCGLFSGRSVVPRLLSRKACSGTIYKNKAGH